MARSQGVKTHELDTPTGEYNRKTGRKTSTSILIGIGGVIALLASALIEPGAATLCIRGAGLGLIGLAVYGGYVGLRDRDQTVRVFLDGLTETRGDQDIVIRWHQIDGVVHSIGQRRRRRIKPNETHVLTLIITDGTRIQYSDATLEEVERWRASPTRCVTARPSRIASSGSIARALPPTASGSGGPQ